MRLYKFLDANGRSANGGNAQWSLPVKQADGSWTPGEWMPSIEGELVPCENGYHLCRVKDLVRWCNEALWVAETRGETVVADDKVVVREAQLLRRIETWNEASTRLLACNFAERVLPLFEKRHPGDTRPRDAIAVARRFAHGQATQEELAAAGDAAWDAAWAAARAAAGDAAWAAARATAGAAAWEAAGEAAWATECEWQARRMCEVLGLEWEKL